MEIQGGYEGGTGEICRGRAHLVLRDVGEHARRERGDHLVRVRVRVRARASEL